MRSGRYGARHECGRVLFMTWLDALWRGAVVVVYFVFATVWLPNFVIESKYVADLSSIYRDAFVVVVWGGALGLGMAGLRLAQARGLFR